MSQVLSFCACTWAAISPSSSSSYLKNLALQITAEPQHIHMAHSFFFFFFFLFLAAQAGI